MKKIIKPFWSYNIVKMEKWLSEMGEKGYILKDVNIITRVFTFEPCELKSIAYKIYYENKGVKNISNTLKNEGWKAVVIKQRWIFICNENKKEEIKINPSRDVLLKRNNIIRNFTWFIICLYGGIYFPILLILGAYYPFKYRTQDLLFMIFLFGVYTVIKLNKLNKELKKENNFCVVKSSKENVSENDIKTIKKLKLGWFYAPDKTEKWLEDLENKGFNLYKISKLGSVFYFKEGRPRKIKYIADYQNIANETYYELHKEDGWKMKFKSIGSVMQWCIWSKEYEELEPEIYTNHEDLLYYAKKILISHSIVFVPALVIYFIILVSDISLFINGDGSLLSTLINLLLIIEFSLFYKNIVAYYFRIKKKIV